MTLRDGSSVFIEYDVWSDRVLLAPITRLCLAGEYAGFIACIAISEALGVTVNMMHMMDAWTKRRMDIHWACQRDETGRKAGGESFIGAEPLLLCVAAPHFLSWPFSA